MPPDPKEPLPETIPDDRIDDADTEEKIAIEEPIEPGDPDGQTT